MQRAVQRQQHNAGDQPQLRRDQRNLTEVRDLLDVLERMRAVVRALGDEVVAKLLCQLGRLEVLAQAKLHVVALRILTADDQAEFHRSLLCVMQRLEHVSAVGQRQIRVVQQVIADSVSF